MSKKNKQYLDNLTNVERGQLELLAKEAGMTVDEWLEFFHKAQIYHNSLEVLTGKEAA